MGLQYPDRCDGCPLVEQNIIAYDHATSNSAEIQTETDDFTKKCKAGADYDQNRTEFVCRTGELVLSNAEAYDY